MINRFLNGNKLKKIPENVFNSQNEISALYVTLSTLSRVKILISLYFSVFLVKSSDVNGLVENMPC